MIRSTTNVILRSKTELQRPENIRIVVLVMTTIVLAFFASPTICVVILGLMLWQGSRGSLTIDYERKTAVLDLQVGPNTDESHEEG